MKKFFKLVMALCVITLVATSCAKNDPILPDGSGIEEINYTSYTSWIIRDGKKYEATLNYPSGDYQKDFGWEDKKDGFDPHDYELIKTEETIDTVYQTNNIRVISLKETHTMHYANAFDVEIVFNNQKAEALIKNVWEPMSYCKPKHKIDVYIMGTDTDSPYYYVIYSAYCPKHWYWGGAFAHKRIKK